MLARFGLLATLAAAGLLVPAFPEERVHFITYGLLGWLICWSLEPFQDNHAGKLPGFLLPCLLVWLAGTVDEFIQYRLPMRVFDIRDILFNGVAGMMGILYYATGNRTEKQRKPSSGINE